MLIWLCLHLSLFIVISFACVGFRFTACVLFVLVFLFFHWCFLLIALPSFHNLIARKMDDSNYLHWRQYVEPTIKSHKLSRFIVNLGFLHVISQKLIVWPAWSILSMKLRRFMIKLFIFGYNILLLFFLSKVLGCNHFYEVWKKIHEYFNLQTKSQARQLHIVVRIVRLDSKSMKQYLLKIKNYVDELVGVGFVMKSMLTSFYK